MIRLETANTLLAADTPATGRDALTKGVDMDQPTELLLPILPFLVQVFPTPGKETIPWGGFLSILRRRGVPGHRSRRQIRRGNPVLRCAVGKLGYFSCVTAHRDFSSTLETDAVLPIPHGNA